MINLLKKINSLTIFLFLITLVVYLKLEKIEVFGKIYSQNKYGELAKFLDAKSTSLILQTVSGDKRYKNDELTNLYKNLQIIHILIISGGNIVVILKFIHIFIYRKSMINLFLSIIFIYFYGRLISFPETLVRAIQTIFLIKIIEYNGLKISTIRSYLIFTGIFIFTYSLYNLGDSYKLSAIYSLVILFNTRILEVKINNKILSFIVSNIILTITSAYLFSFEKISTICTSLIANIFINLIYDFAIYLAYILYFLPTELVGADIRWLIGLLFSILIQTINFINVLTYNICND